MGNGDVVSLSFLKSRAAASQICTLMSPPHSSPKALHTSVGEVPPRHSQSLLFPIRELRLQRYARLLSTQQADTPGLLMISGCRLCLHVQPVLSLSCLNWFTGSREKLDCEHVGLDHRTCCRDTIGMCSGRGQGTGSAEATCSTLHIGAYGPGPDEPGIRTNVRSRTSTFSNHSGRTVQDTAGGLLQSGPCIARTAAPQTVYTFTCCGGRRPNL